MRLSFVSPWVEKKGALCYFGRRLTMVGVRTCGSDDSPDSCVQVLDINEYRLLAPDKGPLADAYGALGL